MQQYEYHGQWHIERLRATRVGSAFVNWCTRRSTAFRAMSVPLLASFAGGVFCYMCLRAAVYGLISTIVAFPVVFVVWVATLALAVVSDLLQKEWRATRA